MKNRSANTPTSLYLFLTFLWLGATAFGGYMSLVAIVQKQLVEIDKRLKEEDLLDAVSLASILPGPVAVNVIACVGYRMGGIMGAVAAFCGIILPSFLLVILLSWVYFTYGNLTAVKNIFTGITKTITKQLLTVAAGMARKVMKSAPQWIIGAISAILLAVMGGFSLTLGLIVASGVAGYFLFRHPNNGDAASSAPARPLWKNLLIVCAVIALLFCLCLWGGRMVHVPLGIRLLSTFSGISLTLFGGGYVVIPALHELFVDNLGWLSSGEFADGIAIGQITPGPIFITATFIGYKVAGVLGALEATIGMFTPPAILIILLSRYINWFSHSTGWKSAMQGIRAAVIGMIFASGLTIGRTMEFSLFPILIFLVSVFISYKYNVSPVLLILGSGLVGFLLF